MIDIPLIDVFRALSPETEFKQQGNGTYKAKCIFHDERTPSLTITPGSGYFCFGCQKGGKSAVTAVMDYFNYDKSAALDWLKNQFPFAFDEPNQTGKRKRSRKPTPVKTESIKPPEPDKPAGNQDLIRQVLTQIVTDAGLSKSGRRYLDERGFRGTIPEKYGLFSVDEPNRFYKYLFKNFSQAELTEAGLIDTKTDRNGNSRRFLFGNDKFIGIPYQTAGKTEYISLRRYAGSYGGKYRKLFRNNLHLSGKPFYNSQALKNESVWVIEGEFNAIAFMELFGELFGISSVVGISGVSSVNTTALQGKEAIFIFDSDTAGTNGLNEITKELGSIPYLEYNQILSLAEKHTGQDLRQYLRDHDKFDMNDIYRVSQPEIY